MYHTPLTWYEQESLGYKAHFEAFPQSTVVFESTLVTWITKTLPVGPTARYTRSQNPLTQSFFWVCLARAYAVIKECAVTTEYYMIQSSCC